MKPRKNQTLSEMFICSVVSGGEGAAKERGERKKKESGCVPGPKSELLRSEN